MDDFAKFLDQPSSSLIGDVADQLGQECYVVGGFVRDKHLGRPIKMDLDFVTLGSGIELARAVQKELKPKPKLKPKHTRKQKQIKPRTKRTIKQENSQSNKQTIEHNHKLTQVQVNE